MRLDLRRHPVVATGLDHVRVERALNEISRRLAELAGLLLEDADELLAHDLALRLRIRDAGEPGEEPLLGLDMLAGARATSGERAARTTASGPPRTM